MSLEAERSVLAGTALTDAGYDYAIQHLSTVDFMDDDCRCAWTVIRTLRDDGKPADPVTLGEALDRSTDWGARENGFRWSALLLSDDFFIPNQLRHIAYVDLLRKLTVERRLHVYGSRVHEIADGEGTADDKISRVHSLLGDVSSTIPDGFQSSSEFLQEAVMDMQRRVDCGGIIGESTGFPDLDELTNGMDAADMIVLGGRPSMGKSAFAMNVAQHVAKTKPVQVFSLEMPGKSLMERMIAATGPVDYGHIRKGTLDDWTRYTAAVTQIRDLQLQIDDSGGLTIDQLRLRARMAARKQAPGLVVIDYLQQMNGDGQDETQAVGNISRGVKAMAKELGCPVIVLSQLNRGLEQRPDKRPRTSDLRQSGQIEQDADQIWMLYRDEVYNDDSPHQGLAECIVRKARNGEIGTVFFEWQGRHQRFRTMVGPVPVVEPKQSQRRPLTSFQGNRNVPY